MTINYAIVRNSTEGRDHTMCIEGTQGTQARGVGSVRGTSLGTSGRGRVIQ